MHEMSQIERVELLLIIEELIVHLPILPLATGGFGRLGGGGTARG